MRAIRLAFGGMAAIVRRAANAEAAIVGQPWNEATVEAAMAALETDFTPLTDLRASATYRMRVARNLLRRFWLETRPDAPLPGFYFGAETNVAFPHLRIALLPLSEFLLLDHCPAIHPELCRVSPPRSGENYASSGSWIGGWMSLRDGAATMSLDGHSDGVPLRGLSGDALRTVIYVGIFPNVLLSLHPDYVMTHVLVPTAADRTMIECSWAFAPEAVAAPRFDPAYAVDFWDLTNRQDWSACESVQRGLRSPFAAPGPLSPDEDAVYSFVTTVARGYLGTRVGEWPAHAATAAPGS